MKKMMIGVLVITTCVFLSSLPCGGSGSNTKIPTVVILDSIADKYEVVKFNHADHSAIAGNCGMCHHQHGDSGKMSCKDCHSVSMVVFKNSVSNNFLACKNCHGNFNPAKPEMPELKVAYHRQCFQCHLGMGNIGIDPKGCAETCHAKKEKKEVKSWEKRSKTP